MAKKIVSGKSPSGKATKGKPIGSGGPGFIGAKGSSPTVMRGSKPGGKKLVKTHTGRAPGGRKKR